jgi:hypothetical protein
VDWDAAPPTGQGAEIVVSTAAHSSTAAAVDSATPSAPSRRLDQLLEIGRNGWILKAFFLRPLPLMRTRPGGAEILSRMSDKPR